MSAPFVIVGEEAVVRPVTIKHRVLIVHNAYQLRGGEDSVVDAELELLRGQGHVVEIFQRHNDELKSMPRWKAAVETVWSRSSVTGLTEAIHQFRPDIVHFHNTFPLISPSAYWAVQAAGLPVVQTLHNFRLHCPQAMYLREGRVCEDCLGRLPWRSVLHACYRNSRVQSAVISSMQVLHRAVGSYQDKVTRYIALNEFCRQKVIAGGLPAERVMVKPNFVDFAPPALAEREGFLFVGRLSAEKGIDVLVRAWTLLDEGSLQVAGTGPEAGLLERQARLTALGALSPDAVRARMGSSVALVLPSIWYECFPRTLVEAFACALPVIASRLGPLADLIEDGVTGLLFEPGDAADLAEKLRWAQANQNRMAHMGLNARAMFEAEYSPERNYAQLIAIYEDAIRTVATEIKRWRRGDE